MHGCASNTQLCKTKWKKWKSHIHCTSTANFILILNLFPWFPLLVKLVYPLNASLLLRFAKMASPFIAELLLKLLAPLKVSMTQLSVEIAPPLVECPRIHLMEVQELQKGPLTFSRAGHPTLKCYLSSTCPVLHGLHTLSSTGRPMYLPVPICSGTVPPLSYACRDL